MPWWISKKSKLVSEKSALASLADDSDWLEVHQWYLNKNAGMQVDFNINHGGVEYFLYMVYPNIFPDSPPMIYTKDQTLISYHQYGASGELCLEYRPDNWMPTITGADMVSSCYRLLSEEHPDSHTVLHARSAHVSSLGQDLRSSICRFLLTELDYIALNSLQELSPKKIWIYEDFVALSLISSLHSISETEEQTWVSDLNRIEGTSKVPGLVVRGLNIGSTNIANRERLATLLSSVGLNDLSNEISNGETLIRMLVGDGDEWTLFRINNSIETPTFHRHATVKIPQTEQRVSSAFSALSSKNVGIIGCGSVGSKVAASLCRSGVSSFVLVDDDVFVPGNIVRNELDLEYIGTHKVYSLKEKLLKINPKCVFTTYRLSLGGQESSESMSQVLETLEKCDALVDATAEPVAFNMIASASTKTKTPMFWCEVFAGGIGGYISRVRPDIDPTPLEARKQIHQWCDDQDVNWLSSSNNQSYTSEDTDGNIMIASDAEVSIIASHTARFVIDALTEPMRSTFPNSTYFISFSSEWLFSQPFEVFPIELQPTGQWGNAAEPISDAEVLELLQSHSPPSE